MRLPDPRTSSDQLTIEIAWSASPRAGLYFQKDPSTGSPIVYSYGEGGLHANWLPIYNDTNDRFSTEMIVTVPRALTVISNGVLVERKETGDLVTYDWREERPHPNYLIAIYAGDFERGELAPTKSGVPLAYWVPRGRLAEGAFVFRNTTRMVELFSRLFDYEYPWAKYDQVAVPDFPIGAMEHTTVTGHDVSVLRVGAEDDAALDAPLDFGPPELTEHSTDWKAEATISHELAHHWFGDDVTCAGLSEIWLNESFASYLMMLWAEEAEGREELLLDLDRARRHYLEYVDEEHLIRPLRWERYDTPDDIYNNEHTYLKGAAVLHLLRRVLGDQRFFAALGDYLDDHQGSEVTTADFQRSIEKSAAENLDWFFADWVNGGGHPILEVEHRFLPDRKLLDVEIRQVQPIVEGQDLFRLPVTVAITTKQGTREETVWIDQAKEKLLLAVDEKPKLVVVDPWGDLIAEIRHDLDAGDLAEQALAAPLPAALRALRQLAADFPAAPETAAALDSALGRDRFWGVRAEAARLLGKVRIGTRAQELIERAYADSDYRVRKAAVLATAELGAGNAGERLRAMVERDPNGDVVAAAIAALAGLTPPPTIAFLRGQLDRDSWHDEVRIATLRALGDSGDAATLDAVRSYVADRYNEDVRLAALRAWRGLAPEDPELRRVLRQQIGATPPTLEAYAVVTLGELADLEATAALDEVVRLDFDPNLTFKARHALEEIRRIEAGATATAQSSTSKPLTSPATPDQEKAAAMDARISMVTLGVEDLDRSIRFYRDGLGLPMRPDTEGVAFFETRGTWLGLFPREGLAEDAKVPAAGEGFRSFSLAHNVRTREEVDAVLAAAQRAGARIVKPAADTFWGGYSGYFADPDGFLWEVAWNPHFWVEERAE